MFETETSAGFIRQQRTTAIHTHVYETETSAGFIRQQRTIAIHTHVYETETSAGFIRQQRTIVIHTHVYETETSAGFTRQQRTIAIHTHVYETETSAGCARKTARGRLLQEKYYFIFFSQILFWFKKWAAVIQTCKDMLIIRSKVVTSSLFFSFFLTLHGRS